MMYRHSSLCGCLSLLRYTPSLGDMEAKLWTTIMKTHYRGNEECLKKATQDPVWQART